MLKALAQLVTKAARVAPTVRNLTNQNVPFVSKYKRNSPEFQAYQSITNVARKFTKAVYGKEFTKPILAKDDPFVRQPRGSKKAQRTIGSGGQQTTPQQSMGGTNTSNMAQAQRPQTTGASPVQQPSPIPQTPQQSPAMASSPNTSKAAMLENKLNSALDLLSKMSDELEKIRQKLESQNTIAVKFSKTSQSAKDLGELKSNSQEANSKLEKISQAVKDSGESGGGDSSGSLAGAAAGALGGAARGAASMGGRAIRALGRGARLPSYLAGLGIDAIAGGFGVGKEDIDQNADEQNWDKMNLLEKLQSGSARGVEKIGDFLGLSNMSRQARSNRVRSESEYFNRRSVQDLNRMMTNGGGGMNADIARISAEASQRNMQDTTNTGDDMSLDYTKYPTTGRPTPGSATPTGRISEQVQQNLDMVENSLREQGITDPNYIAAVKANVMKESGGQAVSERMNYGGSSNERIRSIFGSRASKYSDEELNAIKSDPQKMGELMYGAGTDIGRRMGNTEEGEGYKFRGRGFIQMTGKNNYAAASQALFGDDRLVKDPDLLNDPETAAKASAWYMKSGRDQMAKQMGMDLNNLTQEQANLLTTSQIAGRAITPGEGYLGKENLDKVRQNAALFATASSQSNDNIAPMQRQTGNVMQAMESDLQTTRDQKESGGGSPTIINNTTNNTSGGGAVPQQIVAGVRNEESSLVRMQNMMAAQAMS